MNNELILDEESFIMDMLDHFHEDSSAYGDWNLEVQTLEEALLINSEFKGVLKAKENKKGTFTVKRVKGSKFKKKHTVLILRERMEMYKEEAERYYFGMKKLLEGQ